MRTYTQSCISCISGSRLKLPSTKARWRDDDNFTWGKKESQTRCHKKYHSLYEYVSAFSSPVSYLKDMTRDFWVDAGKIQLFLKSWPNPNGEELGFTEFKISSCCWWWLQTKTFPKTVSRTYRESSRVWPFVVGQSSGYQILRGGKAATILQLTLMSSQKVSSLTSQNVKR